jgi:hypothetical protein
MLCSLEDKMAVETSWHILEVKTGFRYQGQTREVCTFEKEQAAAYKYLASLHPYQHVVLPIVIRPTSAGRSCYRLNDAEGKPIE